MPSTSQERWIKGYRLILPALFAVAFLLVGISLHYYFVNLPREKVVFTDPNSVVMKLNSTDKLVKLVKITFPGNVSIATYNLVGTELDGLLKFEDKRITDEERFLYISTTGFPSNFTNQTYEDSIKITYYIITDIKGKKNESTDKDEKFIDLTLIVSNNQAKIKPKLNVTN